MTQRAVNGYGASFTPTIIGLLVGDTPRDEREAERYVSMLPDSAVLYAYCGRPAARRMLRAAARERGVAFAGCYSPYSTVRMVQIVVIIGASPFKRTEIDALETQGIPVEWKMDGTSQRRA